MTPWLQWDVWQAITRDKEGSRASIYLIAMEGRASHHHGHSGRYGIIPPWLWWDAGHWLQWEMVQLIAPVTVRGRTDDHVLNLLRTCRHPIAQWDV